MGNNFTNVTVAILAGGKSSRAEMLKGLRTYKNDVWINYLINSYLNLGVHTVYVGFGYNTKQYLEVVKNCKSLKIVLNQKPEDGPFSTFFEIIKESIDIDYEKLILHPVDFPFPKNKTLYQLNLSTKSVAKPLYKNRSGHPIFLKKSYVEKLNKKSLRNSRLDHELRKLNVSEIEYIETDDSSIVLNLNTEKHWIKFLEENP